jgi:hypothetical protein
MAKNSTENSEIMSFMKELWRKKTAQPTKEPSETVKNMDVESIL